MKTGRTGDKSVRGGERRLVRQRDGARVWLIYITSVGGRYPTRRCVRDTPPVVLMWNGGRAMMIPETNFSFSQQLKSGQSPMELWLQIISL